MSIKGAFFAEEMRAMLAEGRIRQIKIETDVRAHAAWDLGVSRVGQWFEARNAEATTKKERPPYRRAKAQRGT
jgi:hypothetical protein